MIPPFYLTQIPPNPHIDGGQDQTQFPPFTVATDPPPSFPFPILFGTPEQQQILLQSEPVDHLLLNSFPTKINNNIMEQSFSGQYVGDGDPQGKWMSSKMRIMRKMMNSDQIVARNKSRTGVQLLDEQRQQNQENSSSYNTNTSSGDGIIRVCTDCHTTKTPLWRSGPCGPKSLCNACGIRQRKARRALAGVAVETPKVRKDKRAGEDRTIPFKKRCKKYMVASGMAKKKLRFEDFTIKLSKRSSHYRVFPQDERDAAILLMALSCWPCS